MPYHTRSDHTVPYQTRPDRTRSDQTRPDQARPSPAGPDRTRSDHDETRHHIATCQVLLAKAWYVCVERVPTASNRRTPWRCVNRTRQEITVSRPSFREVPSQGSGPQGSQTSEASSLMFFCARTGSHLEGCASRAVSNL